jgi:hypothetical protein
MTEYKKKTRLYKVYHIRELGNTEVSEGYIGITRRSLSYRLSQHRCSPRPIGIILRTGIPVEIVQLGVNVPKEDALYQEGVLRPKMNMGWNVLCGGNRSNPEWRKTTGRNTKFCKGHEPHNTGRGEMFELTSPEGTVYRPEVFTVFCREHNLAQHNLRKVAKGLRKHSSGWIARKIG